MNKKRCRFRIPILHLFTISAFLFSFSAPVLAFDFSPDKGLWIIEEENNGKPGRGLQIDIQNDALVLSFYAYDAFGAPKWWMATGVLSPGSNDITMDLQEYEGGHSFGSPPQNATLVGVAGTVTLRFIAQNAGQICLPDEFCKNISPFIFGYAQNSNELLGVWFATLSGASLEAMLIEFNQVLDSPAPGVADRVKGTAILDEDFVAIVCERPVDYSMFRYSCAFDRSNGETVNAWLDVSKNMMNGLLIHESVGIDGWLTAFRVQTATGRSVIPN